VRSPSARPTTAARRKRRGTSRSDARDTHRGGGYSLPRRAALNWPVGTDGSARNGTQRRKQRPGAGGAFRWYRRIGPEWHAASEATGQGRRGRCLPLVPTDRPGMAPSVGSNRADPARAVPSVGTDGSARNGTQRRKQPGRATTGQGRRGRCLPLVPTDRPGMAPSVGSNRAGQQPGRAGAGGAFRWYRRIGPKRHAASEATTRLGRCPPLVPTRTARNGTQRRKQPGKPGAGNGGPAAAPLTRVRRAPTPPPPRPAPPGSSPAPTTPRSPTRGP
jgi:hypothetical protein